MYKNLILNIISKLDIQTGYNLVIIFPEYNLLDYKKIMETILDNVNKFQNTVHYDEDLFDTQFLGDYAPIIAYPSNSYLEYLRQNNYQIGLILKFKSEASRNSDLKIAWCDLIDTEDFVTYQEFDSIRQEFRKNTLQSFDNNEEEIYNVPCLVYKSKSKLEIPYYVFKLYQKYGDKLINEVEAYPFLGYASQEDSWGCNEFQDYFPLYEKGNSYIIGINCNPESKYFTELAIHWCLEENSHAIDLHINLDPLLNLKSKNELKEFWNKNNITSWDTECIYKAFKHFLFT